LLEVGTGFHPELTGRENIFLNGAILGMTKAEIRSKLDEIVDFSGCERYIDTPVKRYSSGMTVRLGFAVAAHLEPEILVIDEVLAVGDAEFQKKAVGKMQDVSRNEGRTVLFVSHNMVAVKQLCNKAILLEKGSIKHSGSQNEVVDQYLRNYELNSGITDTKANFEKLENKNIKINYFDVRPLNGNQVLSISSGFEFELRFINRVPGRNLAATFELRNIEDVIVFHHATWICTENNSKTGQYTVKGIVPRSTINAGIYKFHLIIAESLHSILYQGYDIFQFEIQNEILAKNINPLPGILRPDIKYTIDYTELK
jgi:lipopolysaccharide transport system ATP-binding protein